MDVGALNLAYSYNLYGEIDEYSVSYCISGNCSLRYSYQINERYSNGKIKKRTEGSDVWEYRYDNVGRLSAAAKNGTWKYYGYDKDGNRTSVDGLICTFDAQDRLAGIIKAPFNDIFEYLEDGSLTSQHASNGLGNFYRNYDAFGKITQVEGGAPFAVYHEYKHDALGRLIQRDDKRYIYYNILNPAAEVDANGVNKAVYVYGTRMNTPDYMITADGTRYYFATDHLGSVRMLINVDTGEIKHNVQYDEWGVITSETGDSTLHPFRFAGGLDMDGWYKFGARYYDPANGRWTQKDPILFAGGDVNLYGYVMGDPVNFIDPTGLIGDWFTLSGYLLFSGGSIWVIAGTLGLTSVSGVGIFIMAVGGVMVVYDNIFRSMDFAENKAEEYKKILEKLLEEQNAKIDEQCR